MGTSAITPQEENVRGKPVSGRVWKKVQKTRSSAAGFKATREISSTWEAKMAKKNKLKAMQSLQLEIKQRKRAEIEEKKKKKEEKEKRRLENEFKSATVQNISRTGKLKTMSKKQLRQIKKTIVNKQGVVEYVPVYQK